MKEVLQKLLDLQPEIHQTNVEKGFWPENRNKGEAVMLMISELSEAVEAHRKSEVFPKFSRLNVEEFTAEKITLLMNGSDCKEIPQLFVDYFEMFVKDTVEDEFADTIIRILDYCYGFKIPLSSRDDVPGFVYMEAKDNFAYIVLKRCHNMCNALLSEEIGARDKAVRGWNFVFLALVSMCEFLKIDILQHVQWKLRYNKTRPHQHGKAY